MDIAFVNRFAGISRGGGEMWDLKMAEGLERRGAEITFYVGKPLRKELPEPIEEFNSVAVDTPHLRDVAYSAPRGIGGTLADIDKWIFSDRIKKNLRKTDHDIIHINGHPRFAPYISEFDVPVTIKMNGPPHSLWYDVVNPFTSSYDFFEAFDTVIATGVTTQEIQERTSCGVHTINPGVDTDKFSPDGESMDWDRPTVLFVGRFVPAKDLSELLEGFAIVHKEIPESQLVLVGDGPLRERYETLSNSLGLNGAVSFTGYIDPDDVPDYYRGADVFALSSDHESFGMVLLEALACGTPVVAPEIDYIPQIVEDGQCGLLYCKGDENDLADSLRRILKAPKLATKLGSYGQKRAVNHYTWAQQSEHLHQIFRDVVMYGEVIKRGQET